MTVGHGSGRHAPGAWPVARLNARLKASSDSYPTRRATAAMPSSDERSRSIATCIRQSVRYRIGREPEHLGVPFGQQRHRDVGRPGERQRGSTSAPGAWIAASAGATTGSRSARSHPVCPPAPRRDAA